MKNLNQSILIKIFILLGMSLLLSFFSFGINDIQSSLKTGGNIHGGSFNVVTGNPHDGSDDPYDSYALVLGHLSQGGNLTKSSFNTKISLTKTVTVKKYPFYYRVHNHYKISTGTWKYEDVSIQNDYYFNTK